MNLFQPLQDLGQTVLSLLDRGKTKTLEDKGTFPRWGVGRWQNGDQNPCSLPSRSLQPWETGQRSFQLKNESQGLCVTLGVSMEVPQQPLGAEAKGCLDPATPSSEVSPHISFSGHSRPAPAPSTAAWRVPRTEPREESLLPSPRCPNRRPYTVFTQNGSFFSFVLKTRATGSK